MRERLAASFVLLAVVLLTVAAVIRSYTLGNELRERESARLHQEAVTVAAMVDDRLAGGDRIDAAFLTTFVHPDDRLVYAPDVGEPVEVRGREYDGDGGQLAASAGADGGRVTVAESDEVIWAVLVGDPWSLAVLFGLALVLALGAGLLVARALAAPFRRLADAAGALGRGRFDLDLPRTRVPEAVAISQALSTSADQLRERLQRDREFAAHASHTLRSPLTGLRLELDELVLRDDLPDDARATLTRALGRVERVDEVAGELVALQRGSLVGGAVIPLRDLATQVAQRWADELAASDRELTAAVEGELDQRYTPGPVEHLLEVLLPAVSSASRGAVRLVLEGERGGLLRITVTAERSRLSASDDPFADARAVCSSLGGRWSGAEPMDGLEILLPRR